jgi:phytoene synthase
MLVRNSVAAPAPLDDTLINRAAPPGSMRYFSLLYAPMEVRTAVTALFVIDAEIRESAQSINHDVAHTRLQWWRTEIDRLVNGNPQHPATRALNPAGATRRAEFAKLHELVVAADMDLARMTYVNTPELRAYASRSGGAIAELIAITLDAGADAPAQALANRLGLAVRLTETVRDARTDAYGGRLYVPLDALDRQGAKLEDFAASAYQPATRAALRSMFEIATQEFAAAMADISGSGRAYLRPLMVLAALHRQLLKRMAARNFDVAGGRIDLGPIEKPWIAWRAARAVR